MNIENIKTAYDSLGPLVSASNGYQNSITDLGEIPQFPVLVYGDSDYNNVLTTRRAWTTTHGELYADLRSAKSAQIAAEINLLQYLPDGQWVHLTGLSEWGINTEQWIATKPKNKTSNADNVAANGCFYIMSSNIAPTQPWPLI